jgi:[acyl-carrier-protein] S-malonyltransferase
MSSAAQQFAAAVEATPFLEPVVPVIGNISAKPLRSINAVKDELKRQLTSPVNWTGSMQYLLGQGVGAFVEVGPGEVLLGLLKRIDRQSRRIKFTLDHLPPDL